LSVYLAIFGILFYFDNKDKFIDKKGKKRESRKVKWVLLKLASTLSIAEIEYNTMSCCKPQRIMTVQAFYHISLLPLRYLDG
jgi:hypothetical protein